MYGTAQAAAHGHLTRTYSDAARRSGRSTRNQIRCGAVPWPLPSTISCTSTVVCPAETDWCSVTGGPTGNSHLGGHRSRTAVGTDLAANGNPARGTPRPHDRNTGDVQRRVMEPQVEQHPAGREQDDSERTPENPAQPGAAATQCRRAAAPGPLRLQLSPRSRRCGGNPGTVPDHVPRHCRDRRLNGHVGRLRTGRRALRHRAVRRRRIIRRRRHNPGGRLRQQPSRVSLLARVTGSWPGTTLPVSPLPLADMAGPSSDRVARHIPMSARGHTRCRGRARCLWPDRQGRDWAAGTGAHRHLQN